MSGELGTEALNLGFTKSRKLSLKDLEMLVDACIPKTPYENAVLVIWPAGDGSWSADFSNQAGWVKPKKMDLNSFVGRKLRGGGSFGVVYESKKRPGALVRKILRPERFIFERGPAVYTPYTPEDRARCSQKEQREFWKAAVKEFVDFCSTYPDAPGHLFQKLRLEQRADVPSELAEFKSRFCAARMSLQDLGAQNFHQYVLSQDSLYRSPNRFARHAFIFSVLADVLLQLAALQDPSMPDPSRRRVHLDVKELNIIIKTNPSGLPSAYLVDFGGSLHPDLCATDTVIRSTYPDIRAFILDQPHHPSADVWSLGVMILSYLSDSSRFNYERDFMDPMTVEKREKAGKPEELEALVLLLEGQFLNKCAQLKRYFLTGDRISGVPPSLREHYKNAIGIIFWLIDTDREARMKASEFAQISEYLKLVGRALWANKEAFALEAAESASAAGAGAAGRSAHVFAPGAARKRARTEDYGNSTVPGAKK